MDTVTWQGCKGFGMESNHQPHIPLQEERLKPITTKTFADFLEVLLTVAGLVACKQCGLDTSWCLQDWD